MAYIGSPVQQVLSRPTSQSFNGDGSTTVFTLNRSVNVSEELEVFVSNVQQEPGVGKSYTANGTSLTFDEAPPSGTGNIYVIYRGLSEVTRVLEHHHNNPLAATTGTFSGNVGIGTTSPGGKLTVYSPISTTYANGNTNITNSLFNITNSYTTSTANAQANMQLGIYDGTYNRVTGIAAVAESATNRKASLAFWTDDSGSRTEKLRITGDGNVGIGTTDPGAKLEVDRGSASFAAIFGAPQGSGRAVLFKDNHASPNRYNYLIGSQYNINNGFEITPSTAVGGTTFSNPAIAILETGKIGIGTNSPGRQLEITDGNSGKIRVSGPDGGMIECWNGSHGVYFGSGLLVTGTGNTQDSVIFVEGGGSQRYYTSGYERMRIDSGGKVGIGNNNPQHKFHITHSGTGAIPTDHQMGATSPNDNYQGIHNNNNSATFSGLALETRTSGASRWLIANEWKNTYLGDLVFRNRNGGTTSQESMRIDSSGRITMPTQPSFMAYGGFAYQASTYIWQGFATVDHNIGSHWNNNIGRFTAPIAGKYMIYATVHHSAVSTYHLWAFLKNGSLGGGNWVQSYDASTGSATTSKQQVWNLAAGDYLEVASNSTYANAYLGGYVAVGAYLIG